MIRALSTVLLLALAFVPAAEAEVLAHSWLDVIPVGFHFGMGFGLYDPGVPPGAGPPVYCAAVINTYAGSPLLLYYVGLRYWVPAVSAGPPVPVRVFIPELTNCGGLVPNNHFAFDSIQLDAGGVFWSLNILGANEVALLGSSSIWVNYCPTPFTADTSNTAGVTNGLVAVPGVLEAMGARLVACTPAGFGFVGDFANVYGDVAGDLKGHVIYPTLPHPNCANTLGVATAPGEFGLVGPVFLSDANCNSLVNSAAAGGADFLVQHCVAVDVLDLISGVGGVPELDEDHFVVMGLGGPGLTGSLLPWVTALGVPADLFPHVSNLEPNRSLTCFPECSDGIDNDGDGFTDLIGGDLGCSTPWDADEN